MQKLAFEFYVPDGICEGCLIEPVFIKRRGLCKKCYGEWYKKTANREDKKNVKISPRYTKKPPHNVLWYRRRAITKYGPDIINDLRAIKTKQYWTLTQVGEKYGFTREYARQLFKTLFGKDYGAYLKQKTAKRKSDFASLNCANDPRHKVADYKDNSLQEKGAKAELLVFNKCKEMGFDVEVPCDMVFDLKINGFSVDIKSADKAITLGGKSTYFGFRTRPHQYDQCDFYVCYAKSKDTFYIIPKIAMSPTGCYIRENNIRYKSGYIPDMIDYDQYKEAWHLLTERYPTEIPIIRGAPKQDKETKRQKRHEYYQANRNKIIAQNRAYYHKNRDQHLANCKEYYLCNKAKPPKPPEAP